MPIDLKVFDYILRREEERRLQEIIDWFAERERAEEMAKKKPPKRPPKGGSY